MECSKCGYAKWDGHTPHDFAGRESAGVKCFGPPRVRRAADIMVAFVRRPHIIDLGGADSDEQAITRSSAPVPPEPSTTQPVSHTPSYAPPKVRPRRKKPTLKRKRKSR